MGWSIQDPRSSRRAYVDKRNRVISSSISETESNYAVELGLKHNINTGEIILTDANETTVLYIRNNDQRDMYLDAFFLNIGASTGGTGFRRFKWIRNPETGNIIDNANTVEIGITEDSNNNFGSSLKLNADIYKGASGEAPILTPIYARTNDPNPSGRISIIPGGLIILKQGNSVALNYTPPAGNTSQVCEFGANAYLKEIT